MPRPPDGGDHTCQRPRPGREGAGEDLDLLEAIVSNDDNLGHGNIVSAYTGQEESITALTGRGAEELHDMLRGARITMESRHQFLDDFVDDKGLVARLKEQSPQ